MYKTVSFQLYVLSWAYIISAVNYGFMFSFSERKTLKEKEFFQGV